LQAILGFDGRVIGLALRGAWLCLLSGAAAYVGKRIGLSDQAGQFGEWIAFGSSRRMLIVTAIVSVVRGIGSVLVSLSHRDDASPFGKAAKSFLQTKQPLPDTLTYPQGCPGSPGKIPL
jgi:hypothetical protein